MNETKNLKLTKMDEWYILGLVNEKILYYQKLKQEWAGDGEDDYFSMSTHCDNQIHSLTQIKNILI